MKNNDSIYSLIGGCVGGILNTIIGHPFDTIKVRLQTKNKKSFNDLIRSLSEEILDEEELDEITTTGDVAGLSLNLSTGADDTTIYVGRSLLDTLSNFTTNILANSGKIADKIFELNSDLTQNALETNQLNEKMENLKACTTMKMIKI